MGQYGWPFASVDPFPGADVDNLYNAEHIKDLYLKSDPNYEGKFTVPVLWDKKTHSIVNNESSEIILSGCSIQSLTNSCQKKRRSWISTLRN